MDRFFYCRLLPIRLVDKQKNELIVVKNFSNYSSREEDVKILAPSSIEFTEQRVDPWIITKHSVCRKGPTRKK